MSLWIEKNVHLELKPYWIFYIFNVLVYKCLYIWIRLEIDAFNKFLFFHIFYNIWQDTSPHHQID